MGPLGADVSRQRVPFEGPPALGESESKSMFMHRRSASSANRRHGTHTTLPLTLRNDLAVCPHPLEPLCGLLLPLLFRHPL